ncbi:MAG TPA: hypothetical protein VFO34_00800 [Candidatus Acidoferrales bacterium]|nr:hypothetical protein [Candidatus Acidoferrales bacterium]
MGFAKVTALIGDAHTYLQSPRDDPGFPLTLVKFGEDYRVVAAGPGAEQALGDRVLAIQQTPVARAAELLYQLFSQDENPTLAESYIAGGMTLGAELHGLNIITDRSQARYTFLDDAGKQFELQLRATSSAAPDQSQWKLVTDQTPLYRQHPGERFWCEFIAAARTLYCNVRAMRNLAEPEKKILQLIDVNHPDKVVLDLRQNSGGDFNEGLNHLVHPIRDLPSINRKGHLFVIIGPNTFSAAMANAAHFRAQTQAILVGRTIGEKPNSYQEPRQMTLPNSHLTVRYSTEFYKFVETGENIIRPDQEIPVSWDDYKQGRDPALEWILSFRQDR